MQISTGVDIEKIARFEGKTPENSEKFLRRIFTKNELEYCFSKAKPAQHLAARYCAKEAVVKALCGFNIKEVYYCDVEILKDENDVPYAIVEKCPYVDFKISLSHCKDIAIAHVLALKNNL